MGAIGDLSLAAVDILWEDLELGAVPFPLEVRGHGDTVEERARIRAAVYDQLERRDLAWAGRAGAELANTLRLLASPKLTADLVALREMSDRQPIRAVVAVRGRRAVLAVQGELAVRVSAVRDSAIAAAIVGLLPPNRPGPGQSVTLPAAVLDERVAHRGGRHRRAESSGGVLSTATRQTQHATELRFLNMVMERPVVRAGSMGVTVRDEHGRLDRLPGFGFFDTDQGRYLTSFARGVDGVDWTTLSPADANRLTQRLTETMVAALRH
jgi:ESX secretion-associated protein EspG